VSSGASRVRAVVGSNQASATRNHCSAIISEHLATIRIDKSKSRVTFLSRRRSRIRVLLVWPLWPSRNFLAAQRDPTLTAAGKGPPGTPKHPFAINTTFIQILFRPAKLPDIGALLTTDSHETSTLLARMLDFVCTSSWVFRFSACDKAGLLSCFGLLDENARTGELCLTAGRGTQFSGAKSGAKRAEGCHSAPRAVSRLLRGRTRICAGAGETRSL